MATTPKIRKWPAIHVGILSIFDPKGEWTMEQIRNLMPEPAPVAPLSQTLFRGSVLTSLSRTPSSSPR